MSDTPSHLFYGRRILDNNDIGAEIQDVEVDRWQAVNRMKQINESVQHFWKRWVHEYLLELKQLHKFKGIIADVMRLMLYSFELMFDTLINNVY